MGSFLSPSSIRPSAHLDQHHTHPLPGPPFTLALGFPSLHGSQARPSIRIIPPGQHDTVHCGVSIPRLLGLGGQTVQMRSPRPDVSVDPDDPADQQGAPAWVQKCRSLGPRARPYHHNPVWRKGSAPQFLLLQGYNFEFAVYLLLYILFY